MVHVSVNARRDLEQVVRSGLALDLGRGEAPAASLQAPLRKSAVLILFSTAEASRASAKSVADIDVLLTRRAEGLRHHAGQIAFPGGGVEPGDAGVEAAALRETAEETGIDPGGIDVLGSLPEVLVAVSGNLVTPVVGWCDAPGNLVADEQETTDVWRIPVAMLLDPSTRGTSVLRLGERSHRGPAFVFQSGRTEHVVWGFTGMLLSGLFDRAGWTRPWDESRLIPVYP